MRRTIAFLTLLAATHACATPNRCLQLDGTGEALIFGGAQNLSTNFTVACWFQPDDPALTGQTLLAQRGPTLGTGWAVHLSHGALSFALNDGTVTFSQIGNVTITDTNWHHLGATYDASVASLYLDGVGVAQGPVLYRPMPSVYPVTIGAEDVPGDPRRFVGRIDEVQLWSSALSSSAMANSLPQGLTGSEPGLVGYWPFTTAADRSGAGNSISLQSGADLITEEPRLQVSSFSTGVLVTLALQPPGASFQLMFRPTLGDPWQIDSQALMTGSSYQWIRFRLSTGSSGFWAVQY
ncbi:MAG: LamG domain-containing protein [Limisphaerales bacterium]